MEEHKFLTNLFISNLAWARLDSSGQILTTSPNWSDLGFSDQELGFMEGILPDVEYEEIHLPMVLSEKSRFFDFDVKRLQGDYLVVARDVSGEARAIQELQQVKNELEIIKRDLIKSHPDKNMKNQSLGNSIIHQTRGLIYSARLAALGEMSSGLSHEINNPLMIMKGSLEIIERLLGNEMNPRIEKYLVKAKNAVDRMAYIVVGLKNFSGQGQHDAKIQVPLSVIIEESFAFCYEMIKAHGLELQIDSVPDVRINCRALQIAQALFNLIKNSDDSLQLNNNAEKWIKLSFRTFPDRVRIELSDSGSLIRKENVERIFQPFFTTKKIGDGAGLGLPISRGIIEEHLGQLWLDQSSGFNTFVIELPLAK